MNQSTLQDFQSSGVECPRCDYNSETYAGLGAHWRHNHDGIPAWKRVECTYCGCEFARSQGNKTESNNEFCSQECYHDWEAETGAKAGRNNPLYKEPLALHCEECGGEYEVPPVHSDSRFCSAGCRHDWMRSRTGSDHPLYKGGYDYYASIRRGLSDVGWRTLRQRHNGSVCENCGSDTSPGGRDLSLHHIVPILSGGTNGAYNFMTLCEPCHSKVEAYCSDLPGFDSVLVE